jgi:diguanylate cyclase (GGDEF)-like protein
VAQLLRSSVRLEDIVCRVGGDEFVILMRGADRATAWLLAERLGSDGKLTSDLRSGAALKPTPETAANMTLATTLSIGIALSTGPDLCPDPDVLLAEPDQALYAVKRSGKGRFCIHGWEEPEPVTCAGLPCLC